MAVPAGVLAEADTGAWLRDALAPALEASERWEQLAAELREENARHATSAITIRETPA